MATRLNTIELTGRVLGAIFYHAPDSEAANPLITALRQPGWETQWPVSDPALAQMALTMSLDGEESLQEAWQRLFIGPHALPAPPWGSVWLDRESVLFGDSTLALRAWMQQHAIAHHSKMNEPEDQFGTLLMLAAWLAGENKTQQLNELLAEHLLPWSDRFLTVFIEQAGHPFWKGAGELALLTLDNWRMTLPVEVRAMPLYR